MFTHSVYHINLGKLFNISTKILLENNQYILNIPLMPVIWVNYNISLNYTIWLFSIAMENPAILKVR